MPGEEETEVMLEKPKRAPRKRVAKPVSENGGETPTPVKRAPRRRAPSKASSSANTSPPRVSSERSEQRKAPTPIAAQRATKKSAKRQTFVVILLMLLGIGSSAAVGFTDIGKIDVNKIIEDRNKKVESGELQGEIVPVQNTNQEPDGGLIQLSVEERNAANAARDAQATAAASTTAANASSSENMATSTAAGMPATPQELGQEQPATETPTQEPAPQ